MRNFLVTWLSSMMLLASLAARAEDATPAPAPATAPAPAAVAPQHENAHLGAAQRLYQKLDLDAAIAELQQAETGATEDDTVQILIYRGLIYADQGKSNEAIDQFKRALAIRPWAEVPAETSPRIAKNFSEARKSLWGSNIKPPKKQAQPQPEAQQQAVPASTTQTVQEAQPAVAPAK
jgi:tetratricopeptide (TPR) repeat protein